jgi:aminoglycoside phosphotransferase (APT) family kinase protein
MIPVVQPAGFLDRYPELMDIPGADTWYHLGEAIDAEGMNGIYAVMDQDEHLYELQIADRTDYERIKGEFEHHKALCRQCAAVPHPVGFGFCARGSRLYLQIEKVQGRPLSAALPQMPAEWQYALGTEAAISLKLIHQTQAPGSRLVRRSDFIRRVCRVTLVYRQVRCQLPGISKLLRLIEAAQAAVTDQRAVLLHGGFQPENLTVTPAMGIMFAPLRDWRYGDPLQDLANTLIGMRWISVPFAIGILDTYFCFKTHSDVLAILSGYAALALIERYTQACQNNSPLANTWLEQTELFCRDFTGDACVAPNWYKVMRKAITP